MIDEIDEAKKREIVREMHNKIRMVCETNPILTCDEDEYCYCFEESQKENWFTRIIKNIINKLKGLLQ